MLRTEFVQYLQALLKPEQIKDFCPNGLQIQGAEEVTNIVTGVTATEALIDEAIALKADTILVHHGYFWKGENQTLTGMKYQRIKKLLDHNINLFAYHLPLDIHPELGNNAQLAKLLGIKITGPLELGNPVSVPVQGELPFGIDGVSFNEMISKKLNRQKFTYFTTIKTNR